MSGLNPTLAGAVAKAERGIGFLKLPDATSDHLRQAMDHFKSAYKLAASHRTVLVELEEELPEPGPALFDGAGEPAPGAVVTQDDVILSMTGDVFDALDWKESAQAQEDLWFAVRVHFRLRRFDLDRFRDLRGLFDDVLNLGGKAWDWMVQEVKTSGDFIWPYLCERPDCVRPREIEETLCPDCERERRHQEWEAERQARLAAAREKSAKKPKKAPKAPRNPLEVGSEERRDI